MSLPFGYFIHSDFQGHGLILLGLWLSLALFASLTVKLGNGHQTQRSRWLRSSILALRTISIGLILLLVIDPEISLARVSKHPKRVAIVVDDSRSMRQAWQGSEQELKEAIGGVVQTLAARDQLEIWDIQGRRIQLNELAFDQELSPFRWSPVVESSEITGSVYAAVMLISDGQVNRGRSPLDLAWTKQIPIYPIMPLPPEENHQLKLLDTDYSWDQENDNTLTAEVAIQQSGLAGKLAKLELRDEDGSVLVSRKLTLGAGFSRPSFTTRLTGKMPRKLEWVLTLVGGELQTTRSLTITREAKLKNLLLVSERVNALQRTLLTLLPDSIFKIYKVQGTGLISEAIDVPLELPQQFDLIMLNQPGKQVANEGVLEIVKAHLDSNAPLILFNDATTPLDDRWSALLHTRQLTGAAAAGEYGVRWGSASQDHPLYLSLLGQGLAPTALLNFPPILLGTQRLEHAGQALLVAGYAAVEYPVLTLANQPPLAIFNGQGLWKWNLNPQSRSSFQKIWDQLLIYLNDIGHFAPVTIKIPKAELSTGAYLTAQIEVKDMEQHYLSAAEVRVRQTAADGESQKLDIQTLTPGKFTTELNTMAPGKFEIIAEAYRFGELWGRDTSTIELVAFNGEDQSKGVNQGFLQRLATHSGGAVITAGTDPLPNIPVGTYTEQSTKKFQGVRSPGVFVTLLTLMILEWIIRRRNGLL